MISAHAAEPSAVEGITYAGSRVAPIKFDGDLRNLPTPPPGRVQAKPYRPLLQPPGPAKVAPPEGPTPEAPQPAGPLAPMPSATQKFAGLSFTDSCVGGTCGAGWPPDPNGDVGPNHYI